MALFLSNRDGDGKTDEEGHYKFPINTYTGNILNVEDLAVSAQSPAVMRVNVAVGQYRIPDTSGKFAYTGWSDSVVELIIGAADTANARISTVILYVDKSEPTSPIPPNNPNVCKIITIDGTAAASPVAPSDSQIKAIIGSNNPYIVLANITVPANATSIATSNIADGRTFVKLKSNLYEKSHLAELVYPIGSLYINTSNATSPATLLGFGTWSAFGAGRVPVGKATSGTFATAGATGGAETHTLTTAQIPSHTHGQVVTANTGSAIRRDFQSDGSAGPYDQGVQTMPTGGGGAHNNLQPYIVVYMWTRTA